MPDYRIALAWAVLTLLGGCASEAKRQEAEFGALKLALPGVYSSEGQMQHPIRGWGRKSCR